jgi:hypothetical protein
MNNGLNSRDMKRFKEMLIKANDEQVSFIANESFKEDIKRLKKVIASIGV